MTPFITLIFLGIIASLLIELLDAPSVAVGMCLFVILVVLMVGSIVILSVRP